MNTITDTTHEVKDGFDRQVLTVGALRAMLADVPDDRHVVLAKDDWYVNVATVAIPADDMQGEYMAVTLYPGVDFDARQC